MKCVEVLEDTILTNLRIRLNKWICWGKTFDLFDRVFWPFVEVLEDIHFSARAHTSSGKSSVLRHHSTFLKTLLIKRSDQRKCSAAQINQISFNLIA